MTEAEKIAAKLTEAQREYLLHGPYPHWTQTRWALERRELVTALFHSDADKRGKWTPLGLEVRKVLEAQQ